MVMPNKNFVFLSQQSTSKKHKSVAAAFGGKFADVTQNCKSFQHISLIGFLKFLLYLMPLVHQCLN